MDTEAIAAFDLLSRMRFACGDNGKRMQDELEEYLRELRKDAERYRTARCMTPHQWSAAWELNVATGKPFDEIIDNMRPFVGGR